MFQQVYNPIGNAFFSTIVAAIPIFTLLYFIALRQAYVFPGVIPVLPLGK